MAPAQRRSDAPIVTNEEFQKWRRRTFHHGWDYDERDFEEEPTPFVPDQEARKAWFDYWRTMVQNRYSRASGTDSAKVRTFESRGSPLTKQSLQGKTARRNTESNKKEAASKKPPRHGYTARTKNTKHPKQEVFAGAGKDLEANEERGKKQPGRLQNFLLCLM